MDSSNIILSSIVIFSILTMGTSSPSSLLKLGKQSTALEVASFYSSGETGGFLKGKVAVLTGGNSGIGLEVMILSRQFNDLGSHYRYNNYYVFLK
jgi:hypothetical protein